MRDNPRCVLGLGCRAEVSLDGLRDLVNRTAHGHRVEAVAALDERARLPAMLAVTQSLDLPLIAIAREAIAGIATPTQSPRILAAFATGSVAEALAMAAIGPNARIVTPRQISTDGSATAALAIRDTP